LKKRISNLVPGDRFRALENLWTFLGENTARKHSRESIELGSNGCGYFGDAVCSFESNAEVEFVPPEANASSN